MTTTPKPDDPTQLLAEHGFTFAEDAPERAAGPVPTTADEADEDDEDLEFQPRQRTRMHWLTIVLIGLVIWGAGFLVGVIVDRSVAGMLG